MTRAALLVSFFGLTLACSDTRTPTSTPSAGAGAACGDGVVEGTEVCEAGTVAGETCLSLGYDSGELGCSTSCTFDTAACVGTAPVCGDGSAVGLEVCDLTDLRGQTCPLLGYDGGDLTCDPACAFDFTGCTGAPPVCGDGNAEGLEECDQLDLQLSCTDLGFDGGVLACADNCLLDTAACSGEATACGDGNAEGTEECDLTDLNGLTCAGLGFDSGSLDCSERCSVDTANCVGTAPVCGDAMVNGLEVCDGTELDGATCESLGFIGGDLACDGSCTFDPTGCNSPVCSNGTLEPGEQCDGQDLPVADCSELGLGLGPVTCTEACILNTSACAVPECGDGVVNHADEACDGTDLDGNSCRSLSFQRGLLVCTDDCTLDTSLCSGSTAECGDDERALSEECEADDLGEATCETLSFDGGDLSCSDTCTWDTGACTGDGPTCPDGIAQGDEMCDGDDLLGLTCELLGFTSGTLACTPQCTLSFVGCEQTATCGDNLAERGERCDGTDLHGQTCQSMDAGTGDLACLLDCSSFDFSDCTLSPECGNDVIEAGETCDGADLGTQTTCDQLGYTGTEAVSCLPTCQAYDLSACTGESARCGDDRARGPEQCDGEDLRGTTCQDLGYDGGELACLENCSFDVTACDE